MTREEAIAVLKEISATLKSWSGFTSYPQAIDKAVEALQREEAEEKGYCLRYLDKGLLMFLALSFPAPEEAPDDWFHHGDENLDAWRAYIMKCKERGYYDIPVEY